MNLKFEPIQYVSGELQLLDQRKLPHEEIFISITSLSGAYEAINKMVVRGAPCIGFTAIYAIALWLRNNEFSESEFLKACDYLKSSRPTAVNLKYEVDRVIELVLNSKETDDLAFKVESFGDTQIIESEIKNRKMAKFALEDLDRRYYKEKYKILTHCNTGFLACGSLGTALGVIQYLGEQARIEKAWVDETRPYLQGSRLTAYELDKLGIEHEIVVEGAASHLMKNKLVDAIFVGADRIVNNGDTANKIGTSNLAIIANHYNIPFYVVAPSSSFDLEITSGEQIEIEIRPEEEILELGQIRIAPLNSKAFNPSFDITCGKMINGIISEKGISIGNYEHTLEGIVK